MEVQHSNDFLRGMRDCKNGVEHKDGQGADYDRGYSAQYQHEQNITAASERNG